MSLIYCPECGHELSEEAVACPSCGRPNTIRHTMMKPRIIIENPGEKESSIPKWVIFPVIILGAIFLFLLLNLFMDRDDTANNNLTVKTNSSRETAPPPSAYSPNVSNGYDSHTVNVPGSSVTAPAPTVGTVLIDAKVATRTGTPEPVRNAKFYLLDKDIESILDDANLEPIDGQTLATSFGIAIADPAKYADFYRDAVHAIKEHIKYAGSTDAQGRAQLGSVKPDSYYLFGATRSGNGFAMWNSTVSVAAGNNQLNLAPQSVSDMPSATG